MRLQFWAKVEFDGEPVKKQNIDLGVMQPKQVLLKCSDECNFYNVYVYTWEGVYDATYIFKNCADAIKLWEDVSRWIQSTSDMRKMMVPNFTASPSFSV